MAPANTLPLSQEIDQFIPLDKSWEIRRIILGLVHKTLTADQIKPIEAEKDLSNDVIALYRCAVNWVTQEHPILPVGESGTLYRILRFLSWKSGKDVTFEKEGSLKDRKICDDPKIIHLTQEELLKLDNGTSQWASASALSGDLHRMPNPPFKLAETYSAIEAQKEKTGQLLPQRKDQTIARQAQAYLDWIKAGRGKMIFTGEQAEDYPFMRAFGLMTMEQGRQKWPALKHHESDRLAGFEKEFMKAKGIEMITVNDHRPVEALAMRFGLDREDFEHPDAVNKSWPRFWDFMGHVYQKNDTLKHS